MRTFYVSFICLLLLSACSKIEVAEDTPSCIKRKISEICREKAESRSVYSYTYKGETVYYIQSGCCDQFNELLDDECNYICAPDGGLAGGGDGLCADFFSEATDETLVWKDPR